MFIATMSERRRLEKEYQLVVNAPGGGWPKLIWLKDNRPELFTKLVQYAECRDALMVIDRKAS